MANPMLRTWLLWWRKWGKKDWAIAAVGFAAVLFTFTLLIESGTEDPSAIGNRPLDLPISADDPVELTLLRNAKDRGAFCLDGSLPGYHFEKGFGSGSNKWVIHIEGGGWCNTIESCSYRSRTALGSSKFMDRQVIFAGMLSRDPSQNPEDSSFGKPLWMNSYQWEWPRLSRWFSFRVAFLTGCSAGGLATLIHCDDFRQLLPKYTTVKCLADAGFFLDEKDVGGHYTMRSFYQDVLLLQVLAPFSSIWCGQKFAQELCIQDRPISDDCRISWRLVL
ncbi:unnamed protein product [Linum tenue]|uniref:Pectin acetylesterase n=1 Tax=Linum tenue TaxID=586396 RepID=A0AAV0PLM0_9ROSI|nr:unnamed protein product [Linum tenue]